jgi:hypothetical protein
VIYSLSFSLLSPFLEGPIPVLMSGPQSSDANATTAPRPQYPGLDLLRLDACLAEAMDEIVPPLLKPTAVLDFARGDDDLVDAVDLLHARLRASQAEACKAFVDLEWFLTCPSWAEEERKLVEAVAKSRVRLLLAFFYIFPHRLTPILLLDRVY